MTAQASHPLAPEMHAAALALNAAHETETGPLDAAALQRLCALAFRVRAAGAGHDALMIALDQEADHDSPNIAWFRARYDRFVYVDRVIVAAHARGRGLARRLYEDLFAAAARAGHVRIACEINVDPPNPGSDAFHAAMGFAEIGRQVLTGRGRTVRYCTRGLGTG